MAKQFLSIFSQFQNAAGGPNMDQGSPRGTLSHPLGPPVSFSEVFSYQSYHDSTAQGNALLQQDYGQDIVASTLKDQVISGYGVGLDPSSETPVSVIFDFAPAIGSSPALILHPGQVLFPLGRTPAYPFLRIKWGLPYGWLGGGLARLVIFRSPYAEVCWSSFKDIIFHKMRLPIGTAVAANPNWGPWPLRFPYVGAQRQVSATNYRQGGTPQIAVRPTRTQVRLLLGTVAAAASMRCLFYYPDQLTSAAAAFEDITWGTTSPVYAAGTWGGVAIPEAPVQTFDSGPLVDLSTEGSFSASAGSQTYAFVVRSANAALQGQYVDFVRWGRLA